MKHIFYKFAPPILVSLGFVLWGTGYILDQYTDISYSAIWLPYIILQLIGSFFCGVLIRNLHQGAYKDTLTGLSNRRCFYEKLASEMEVIKKTKSEICLALLDVDDFKNINDEYGHLEGDKVLKQLSSLLQRNVRAGDIVARWGGEEFAIILPNTTIEGALAVVERIKYAVENYPFISKVTISIGLASTRKKIEIDNFVKMADEVLYKAKEEKNVIISFAEEV